MDACLFSTFQIIILDACLVTSHESFFKYLSICEKQIACHATETFFGEQSSDYHSKTLGILKMGKL